MEALTPLLKTTIALIVVVNPIGAAPIFLSLTHGQSDETRRQMARTAALATVLILLAAALAGKWLLLLFGISLPSFRVAGGVLFLLMGLDMLNARPSRSRETPEETAEAGRRKEIAVVPIAIPQLAGPGAIGSVILFADAGPFWPHMLVVAGVILIVGAIAWVSLRMAAPIGTALGTTGINILTRIMGLIVAAVAVEFIVSGLRALWKSAA
jgi:multiple antibiotic resistance protein